MENKRYKVYITIFAITTIVAATLAVYLGIMRKKDKNKLEKLQDEINQVESKNTLNEDNTSNAKSQQEIKSEIDLNLNGEFVQALYKKLPMLQNNEEFNFAYRGYKTTKDDISKKDKTLFTLEKMKNENKYTIVTDTNIVKKMKLYPYNDNSIKECNKYVLSDVKSEYESIFGDNPDLTLGTDYRSFCYNFEYDENDKCFYGYRYPGGGGGLYFETVLYKAEKGNNEIYLYDYYAENRDGCINGSVNENLLEHVTLDAVVDLREYAVNFKFSHKHTFKLNSHTGNYYWCSSEPLV